MTDEREEATRDAAAQARRSSASRSCSTGPSSPRCRTRRFFDSSEPCRTARPQTVPERREGDRHGHDAADVRFGAARPVPTTPPRSSTPMGPSSGSTARRHIPHIQGFSEKLYFAPDTGGCPDLRDAHRQGRRLHLLRPPLPRGLRILVSAAPEIVFSPSATHRGLSGVPVASRAASHGHREHVLHRHDQPGGRRAARRERLLRQELLRRSRGGVRGRHGDAYKPKLIVRDLDLGEDPRGPRPMGDLSRPSPDATTRSSRGRTTREEADACHER